MIALLSLMTVSHADPLRLSGSVAWTTRLSGAMSPSASLTVSPFRYAFARTSVAYRVTEDYTWNPNETTTFTWGIGYDDWHPGTWSVQLNNWSPNTPESGWAILTGAELDVFYKIAYPEAIRRYLGTSVSINMPLSRSPGVGTRVSVRPWKHIVGFAGIRYSPYNTEGASWTYGLGWADWHLYSFSLNYFNWGPNYLWEPNATQNGQITLSFSWGLEPATVLHQQEPL